MLIRIRVPLYQKTNRPKAHQLEGLSWLVEGRSGWPGCSRRHGTLQNVSGACVPFVRRARARGRHYRSGARPWRAAPPRVRARCASGSTLDRRYRSSSKRSVQDRDQEAQRRTGHWGPLDRFYLLVHSDPDHLREPRCTITGVSRAFPFHSRIRRDAKDQERYQSTLDRRRPLTLSSG